VDSHYLALFGLRGQFDQAVGERRGVLWRQVGVLQGH
jgi:hypothetical protein